MEYYFRADSTSKSILVTGLLIILMSLSACGSSTTSSANEVEGSQPQSAETPASGSEVEGSLPTNSPTLEGQVGSDSTLSYSNDVYPIFEASCIKCHGVEKVSRGLDLTSYEKTIAGSVKGPVILPGDADNSLLVKLVTEGKMPKQGAKLTPEQVEIVRKWISQGAPNN